MSEKMQPNATLGREDGSALAVGQVDYLLNQLDVIELRARLNLAYMEQYQNARGFEQDAVLDRWEAATL